MKRSLEVGYAPIPCSWSHDGMLQVNVVVDGELRVGGSITAPYVSVEELKNGTGSLAELDAHDARLPKLLEVDLVGPKGVIDSGIDERPFSVGVSKGYATWAGFSTSLKPRLACLEEAWLGLEMPEGRHLFALPYGLAGPVGAKSNQERPGSAPVDGRVVPWSHVHVELGKFGGVSLSVVFYGGGFVAVERHRVAGGWTLEEAPLRLETPRMRGSELEVVWRPDAMTRAELHRMALPYRHREWLNLVIHGMREPVQAHVPSSLLFMQHAHGPDFDRELLRLPPQVVRRKPPQR